MFSYSHLSTCESRKSDLGTLEPRLNPSPPVRKKKKTKRRKRKFEKYWGKKRKSRLNGGFFDFLIRQFILLSFFSPKEKHVTVLVEWPNGLHSMLSL